MSFYPLILFPRPDLRFPVQLNKKYPCRVGLTNQLFTLVNGVIKAAKTSQKHIVIDSFLADAIVGTPVHISTVIDLDKTQNNIRGIAGFQHINLYDRCKLANDLSDQFGRARHMMSWYNLHPRGTFDLILRAIEYTEPFQEIARSFCLPQNMSQLHLRLEDDMIAHLANTHHLDPAHVKNTLINKYREAILGHIPRGSDIFLMGHVDHLGLEGIYRFYNFNEMKPEMLRVRLGVSGRELSAIIDYLIGRELTGTFVGSHRLATSSGSTFTYYLMTSLKTKPKRILVDPDNLKNGLEIHNGGS